MDSNFVDCQKSEESHVCNIRARTHLFLERVLEKEDKATHQSRQENAEHRGNSACIWPEIKSFSVVLFPPYDAECFLH